MRNSVLIFALLILVSKSFDVHSQVGINTDTPNGRAVLDLHSPTHDQGLLVPRLSTSQRTSQAFVSRLSEMENGLLIFDTDDKLFYYWMHPSWKAVESGTGATTWRSGGEQPQNTLGNDGDFYLNIVDGNVYRKVSGVYTLETNIRGERGPQGEKGDTGETGPAGPQGIQGEMGAMGPAGPQGLKGDQGDVGPMGPAGPQGLKGDQGDVGPMGPAGPQGLKGDQGDVGPMGPAGPQGLKGDQGDVGPMGPAGPQGLKGDQGDVGPMGPAGPQGLKGDQGDVGPMGPVGPQGLKGDQGDVGPMGPVGPQGLKGDQGDVGPVGPAGPQGVKGDQGDIGPMGPAGPQGIQGPAGPVGPQGPQGEPGIPVAFRAVSVTTNYTATATDDVIIALRGGTAITLPSAGTVPGKVFHIRHNLNALDLLGTVTIRAPSGNSIIDGSASQTFTIGLLNPTAISVIAVDADKWYVISKF